MLPGAHGFEPGPEGVETAAEPAIAGVADVDRTRELSRCGFRVGVGLGALAQPAGVVLRSPRGCAPARRA